MTTTNFVNGVTLSDAGWFNDVDALVYDVFNGKSSAGTSGTILRSNGTNIVNSTATYPNTATGAGTIMRADGTNWVASTATYPDTATSTGTILRADGTNWSATTAAYPTTTTSGRFLISTGANTVSDSNRVTHDGTTFAVTGNQTTSGSLQWGSGTANLGFTVKSKTADESVTSSTTLQNDDHISFTIGANETWTFRINGLAGTALTTHGFRSSITVPSGATLRYGIPGETDAAALTVSGNNYDLGVGAFSAAAGEGLFFQGYVFNGATPGTIQWQWAQQTSSGSALTVKKGTWMLAYRLV